MRLTDVKKLRGLRGHRGHVWSETVVVIRTEVKTAVTIFFLLRAKEGRKEEDDIVMGIKENWQ